MNNNAKPVISVSGLTVAFSRWGSEVTALDNVSLTIPSGQWAVLTGPNGSGKSTLLKAMSGRIKPKQGTINLNGFDVAQNSQRMLSAHVFHIQQDPLLGTAPILTVFENLVVADEDALDSKVSKKQLTAKYLEMLRPLDLHERLKQPVKTLSGGERQLISILIARLRPAPLILLDEPLAALDPKNSKMCLEEIANLNKIGKTLIYVTHNEEHAQSLGHRTILLASGKIVKDEARRNVTDTV